jgi:hypothetical protein
MTGPTWGAHRRGARSRDAASRAAMLHSAAGDEKTNCTHCAKRPADSSLGGQDLAAQNFNLKLS